MTLVAAVGAFSLAALAAAAQPPPAAPPEPATPPEVVVTAPGPALWKLTRGASTVWVLGAIEPMPRGLAWNSAPLAKVIRGARQVLLPPEGSGGLVSGLRAFSRSHLADGARLDAILPPRLDADYRAALVKLGRDPAAPRRDKPAWAALFLEIDFVLSRGADISEPERTVARIARAEHVKVRRVATYPGGAILEELVGLPEAEGEAALAEASAGVSFGVGHLAQAGRAWAVGDLRAMRADVSPAETPLAVFLHTATGRRLAARAVDDTTGALRSALSTPGVAVAVVRLADILQPGGVLDRLRAEGVSVGAPQPVSAAP